MRPEYRQCARNSARMAIKLSQRGQKPMNQAMRRRLMAWLWAPCLVLAFTSARAASADDLDAVLDQSHKQAGTDDFLPPEKAFRLSASADGADRVRLDWIIAPGYYLYRDRIKIADDGGHIGAPQFPAGQVKSDEYFGKQVVYHDELIVTAPVRQAADIKSPLTLNVT